MRLRFNFSSFETEIYLQSKQKLKKKPQKYNQPKKPKILTLGSHFLFCSDEEMGSRGKGRSARTGNTNVIYWAYSPRQRLFTGRAPISKELRSMRQASFSDRMPWPKD